LGGQTKEFAMQEREENHQKKIKGGKGKKDKEGI
jgi:hypothetical protein